MKSLVWHKRACVKVPEHCRGEKEKRGGRGVRKMELADMGGEVEKGRKRGAECSFKWKWALALMAATSNDDPHPPPSPLAPATST